MAVAVSNSLSELDAMLNDMRNHKYSGGGGGGGGGGLGGSRTPNAMDDYSSDYGGTTAASMLSSADAPLRPPPPASYAGLPSVAAAEGGSSRSRAKLKSGDSGSLKLPPRVKPPKLQVRAKI